MENDFTVDIYICKLLFTKVFLSLPSVVIDNPHIIKIWANTEICGDSRLRPAGMTKNG